MNIKKKILIAIDAPGPADSIAPVIPLLRKEADVSVLTIGPTPAARLADFSPIACADETEAEKLFNQIKPDLFFATTSSLVFGPFVIHALSRAASHAGIPIVCFQDYWANHRHPMNSLSVKYWPVMLAQDEIAKKFLSDDHYRGEIVITGNPALDALSKIDVKNERARVRRELGLTDRDFLIVYIGRGTPLSAAEDEVTFAFLAGAIKAMDKMPVLMIRPHPRDVSPGRYEHLSEGLRLIDASSVPAVNSALCAADLVVGMDSTSHIHAVYLRIPAMCLVLPHGGRERLTQMGLLDFPPNITGASIGFYNPDRSRCADIISRVRDDEKCRAQIRAAQERAFPQPAPNAASRVAQEVLRQLR